MEEITTSEKPVPESHKAVVWLLIAIVLILVAGAIYAGTKRQAERMEQEDIPVESILQD